MKRFLQTFGLLVAGFLPAAAQRTFQLAPPYLQFESVFFKKECKVAIEFAKDSTQIRYTTNGQAPTAADRLYTQPILLKKSPTLLKTRVFGEGFIPSDVVEATFYRAGMPIKSAVNTPPHNLYPGSGPKTLTDLIGGQNAFNSKTWMGFQTETVTIELSLAKPKKVKQVMLHLLENHPAWIFLPQKIEVYAQIKGADKWELQSQQSFALDENTGKSHCRALLLNLQKPLKTNRILLKIYPLAQIPEGYPGSGNPAWLFVDEVLLY